MSGFASKRMLNEHRMMMFNYDQYDLFPTKVLVFNNFITEDQRLSMLDHARKTPKANHRALNGNAVSSHGYDHAIKPFPIVNAIEELAGNYESCQSLIGQVREALNIYSNTSGFMYADIKNSWINIQGSGSELKTHRHAGSAISGALYINVDDDSSHLYFDNPNPYIQFNSVNADTDYTYEWYRFKPENGMLILFPGWLSHGSKGEANGTDERVVLSFNTWWRS